MELNLFGKIGLILKECFSSFLYIEIIVIFLLLFLFLLFNFKYQRKSVIGLISVLLVYFLFSFVILFHEDFFLALRDIIKKIVQYFYFSPIPIYYLTILICAVMLIKTMLTKKHSKRYQIVSYLFLFPIFYLFTLFVTEASTSQMNINEITDIYQNPFTLSCIQLSQLIFFLYIGSFSLYYLYRKNRDRFVK